MHDEALLAAVDRESAELEGRGPVVVRPGGPQPLMLCGLSYVATASHPP